MQKVDGRLPPTKYPHGRTFFGLDDPTANTGKGQGARSGFAQGRRQINGGLTSNRHLHDFEGFGIGDSASRHDTGLQPQPLGKSPLGPVPGGTHADLISSAAWAQLDDYGFGEGD